MFLNMQLIFPEFFEHFSGELVFRLIAVMQFKMKKHQYEVFFHVLTKLLMIHCQSHSVETSENECNF